MDAMTQLALATAAFIGTHFISSTPLRAALTKAMGEKAYLGTYSLAAFATLGWMIHSYANAPLAPLWRGLRHLPSAVMPFALLLIVCALMTRNPSAVGQSAALAGAEPARGMLRVTRHPMMWGVALWALAHLLARGDMAALLFFGGFALLALCGTLLIDARKAAALGEDWRRYAQATSNLPFAAIAAGRNQFHASEIGWAKLGIGLALYAVLLFAHPFLFGVRPY